MNETKTTKPAWSARCDCYHNHVSSSGRCTCRTSGGRSGVTDPTRHEGQQAICEECRASCPVGEGTRNYNDQERERQRVLNEERENQ